MEENAARLHRRFESMNANNLLEEALVYIQQLEAQVAEYEKAISDGRMVELPCRPGDDLYWLCDECGWKIKCHKNAISGVVVRGNGSFAVIADDGVEEIGDRWSHLTEESAKEWLEKNANKHRRR